MNDIQSPADPVGDEAVSAEEAQQPEPQEETQADAQAAEDAASASDEDDGDKAEEAESRSQERRRKRREALERAHQEAEQAAAEARKANEALERIRKAGEGKQAPRQADFENYDDYIVASAAYAARKANDDDRAESMTAEQKAAEAAAQAAQQRAAQAAHENFMEAAQEARARYADFDAVVSNPNVPISTQLAEMIAFSDSPAELAYAVAKDRALAGKLSAMNPVEAARQLGRIEAQLSAPKPRVESRAPQPIAPVRGKAGATSDPTKMTPDQYRAWREKGGTL